MADAPRYDDSLTIALLRAREAVTAQFRDHVAAGGMTLTQWRVIRALAGGTELDTTTLAHRCVILAPSLTRIIKTLEGRAGAALLVRAWHPVRRDRAARVRTQGTAHYRPLKPLATQHVPE